MDTLLLRPTDYKIQSVFMIFRHLWETVFGVLNRRSKSGLIVGLFDV